MVGFRAPFLASNPMIRQVLHNNGMLYDSSLIEAWSSSSTTSPSAASKLWPYTMDFGIAQVGIDVLGGWAVRLQRRAFWSGLEPSCLPQLSGSGGTAHMLTPQCRAAAYRTAIPSTRRVCRMRATPACGRCP